MKVIFKGKELDNLSYCASCNLCHSIIEVEMKESELLFGIPTWARINCPLCNHLIATRLSAKQSAFSDRYFNKDYYLPQKTLPHLKYDDVINERINHE